MSTLATIGSLIAKMTLDPSGFVKGAGVVESRAMQMRAKVSKEATVMAGLMGAVVGDAVTSGIQDFGRLDTGMREVFTLMPGLSQQAKDQMTQHAREFAMDFGVSTESAIGGLYTAISAGLPQDNIFAAMEVAQKSATAGVSDVETSLGLLSAVTKGYGDTSVAALTKAGDLAFSTVKLGQTTYPELAASIGKVIPQASALAIAQEEVFATMATLTGVTGNTAEVATQLKAVETSLIKPSADLARVLEEQGFASSRAAIEALGFQGTLEMLKTAAGGSDAALANMIGPAEALTAVLALTGAQSQKLTDNIGELEGAAGAVEPAFREMDSGIEASGRKIAAFFHDLKLTVGKELQALGPIVYALGPSMGRWLGRGLGAAFGVVATKVPRLAAAAGALAGKAYTAAAFVAGKFMQAAAALWAMMGGGRVVALAAAAGTKAGAAYAAASAVAMKAGMVATAGWAAAGTAIGGILGSSIAAAALPLVSLALVAVAVKMGVDLAHNIGQWQAEVQKGADAAVNQPASEAIVNLENLTRHMHEVQGLGRVLGDTFGGEQETSGLLNLAKAIRDDTTMTAAEIAKAGDVLAAAAHEAGARGNEAVEYEILAIAALVRNRTPEVSSALAGYADAFTRVPFAPPDIAGPIRSEFKLATAAVAQGFGSVKAALADPPQMISKDDRLTNMAARMKKVMANIKKATEVGDPMAQRYWEKARAKQQQQIDQLKGTNVAKLGEIKRAYRTTGVSVKGTWTDVERKTKASSKAAAAAAIEDAQGIKTGIEAIDLQSSGVALMDQLAAGIRAGIANVRAAATEAAAAAAAPLEAHSPPREGPLATIDKWGAKLIDAWARPIETEGVGRARRAAHAVAGAFAPGGGTLMPAGGLPVMARAAAGGGDENHFHIGVLVANEAGIDELQRRMDRRANRRSRSRRFRNDPNG